MKGPNGAKLDRPWSICRGGFVEASSGGAGFGSVQANHIRKEDLSMPFWSINTGGHPGVWRLISLLESMDDVKKPGFIGVQEVSCNVEQYKVIARKLDSLGYKAFHSGCVDKKKKGECQSRGTMLWVRSHIPCRLIAAKNWLSCQMVAINVEGVLIISTYTIPGEGYVSEHAAKLYEFFTGLNWQGKWFIAGDFNEEFGGSWISSTAALLGGQQCDINCEASRWHGGKVIDHFITNAPEDLTACEVRYEKL